MSVRKWERRETEFAVVTNADNLVLYTLEILRNPKTFPPGYEEITKRIVENVFAISDEIYLANKIRVGRNRQLHEKRSFMQKDVLLRCQSLTHLITLAKKAFHLRSRRVDYWTGLVLEVEEGVKKWRESDIRRFKRESSDSGTHAVKGQELVDEVCESQQWQQRG